MSTRTTLILLLTATLLTSSLAARMNVQTRHQTGNDCKQYKTCTWLPIRTAGNTGIQKDDPAYAPRIKAAINRELQAKGLKEVPSGGGLQVATAAMRETSPHIGALIYA